MMMSVTKRGKNSVTNFDGSKSIPTETKNKTAKASRKGSVSSVALWLSSELLIIIPAKNAPSAIETPKRCAEKNATPNAIARTLKRKSSLEPDCAEIFNNQGITRRPMTKVTMINRTTFAIVKRIVPKRPNCSHCASGSASPATFPPNEVDRAGMSTSARTIARSSTISHPTAMRPRSVSIKLRSCRERRSTTVLAVERANPKTMPPPTPHPMTRPKQSPNNVATAICTMAPGMAIALTDRRSLTEKCSPTPNINRMMPISAS